jgi:hypothetical protein
MLSAARDESRWPTGDNMIQQPVIPAISGSGYVIVEVEQSQNFDFRLRANHPR